MGFDAIRNAFRMPSAKSVSTTIVGREATVKSGVAPRSPKTVATNNRDLTDKIGSQMVVKEPAKITTAKLVAEIRSNPRVKSKDDLQFEGYIVRGFTTATYEVQGNDLSHFCVVDYGGMRCGLLVSDNFIAGKIHLQLREKLSGKNYEILYEKIADVSLIAEVNDAVNGNVDDTKSSDAQPICDEIVNVAINSKSTDIHICCRNEFNSGMVLNRINGRIRRYKKFSVISCNQVAGILFHESEASSRSPGSFALTHPQINCVIKKTVNGEEYKLRYQFVKAADGWDVIVRILPMGSKKQQTFEQLGYAESQVRNIELSVKRTIGLVGIVGPTGSGKSTTLKTMMEFDPNRLEKKRYSIEDPPEYKIFGVSQIAAQSGKYAETLKNLLRADPDDVMVGETRDAVTASVLADAILTGHKLYTTLHTGSAIAAYTRLNRLGLDRNILADRQFVAVLIFQRLMPVLCESCKISAYETSILSVQQRNMLSNKFKLDLRKIFCSNDEGCEHCQAGVSGLTVVAEVVVPDSALRRFILEGDDDAAEGYWRKTRHVRFDDPNMDGKTAFEHALYKVSQGIIDPRDVENEFEPFETYEIIRVNVDED